MGPAGYELTREVLDGVKNKHFVLFPDKSPKQGEKLYSIIVLVSPGDSELIIAAFIRAGIYSERNGAPSKRQIEEGLPALEINWGNPPGTLNFQDRNPDSL